MKGPSHADGVACRAVMHTGLLMTLARRGMGARRQGLVVSAACMLESVDSAPVLTPNRGHQSCTLSQSSAHPVCEANVRGAWHSRIQQPVGDGNEIVGCGCPNSNALTVLPDKCMCNQGIFPNVGGEIHAAATAVHHRCGAAAGPWMWPHPY